ncbi:hypothetical protein ZWY2020_054682 [Hordeum vulgare]|nr:hypothetical protein ZWY2020_054682 [Hordeum vulgare]
MNPICHRRPELPPPAKTTRRTMKTSSPRYSSASLRSLRPSPRLPRLQAVAPPHRRSPIPPPLLRPPPSPPSSGVPGLLPRRPLLQVGPGPAGPHPSERFSVRFDNIEGGGGDGIWSFRRCRHGRVLFTRGIAWAGAASRSWCGIRHRRPPLHRQSTAVGPRLEQVTCASGCALCCRRRGPRARQLPLEPLQGRLGVRRQARRASLRLLIETNSWGDLISTDVPYHTMSCVGSRSILVRNSLHWFIFGTQTGILELDLDTQTLAVVEVPPDAHASHHGLYLSTLGGGLGFIVVSDNFVAYLWVRATVLGGVAGWMPAQAIDLNKLLPLRPGEWTNLQTVLGVAGDDNVIFVSTNGGVFMVHLESLQFKKIFESNPFAECTTSTIHPFTSFVQGV